MAQSLGRDADRSADRAVSVLFFSSDKHEPPHVHVEREARRAKFWLELVEVETNDGFGARELVRVRRIIEEHREALLRTWYDFFSD
jgi:hypothetical protein